MAQDEEQIRKVGNGVTAPKLIHKVKPEYTKRAKKAKLKGIVKLRMVVSGAGVPKDIEVA